MPAGQGDIFQSPSWFSLIWITSYGLGNLCCTTSTHLPWVGFVLPEAGPVRRNSSQGRSPGRHHYFQHELRSVSSCAKPLFPSRWRHPGRSPAAGTAGVDRGRDEGALRTARARLAAHRGMLRAHGLTGRMPVLLVSLNKPLLLGIKWAVRMYLPFIVH